FDAANTIAPFVHPLAAFNFLLDNAAVNDLVGQGAGPVQTVDQTIARTLNLCRFGALLGMKVIPATVMSNGALSDTLRHDYNDKLRKQAPGVCTDVFDLAGFTDIGADGQAANTTPFPDHVHPAQFIHNTE